MIDTLADLFEAPLRLSALADAKWQAVVETVPEHLEVYAFLLCKPGDPLVVVDLDLPRQVVSGGLCTVRARDVVGAGARAARSRLVVAGSVHRHPFGGCALSGTDRDLLEGMACELASELALPVRVTRRVQDLMVRPDQSADPEPPTGSLQSGVYAAERAEIEETVIASRVYCLAWGPRTGYGGAAANVLYDPLTEDARREYRYLSEVIVDEASSDVERAQRKMRRLARRLVKPRFPLYKTFPRESDDDEEQRENRRSLASTG